MALTVRRFPDAEAFAEAAMLYLLAHEAEHCIVIGVIAQTIEQPDRWPGGPTFLTVDRAGAPVAAAMRTPPYIPVLARAEALEAIPLLVEQFLEDPGVEGVKGPVAEVRAFVAEWTRRTGQAAEMTLAERIYQVERVRPVAGVPGRLRSATAEDRPLLLAWYEAFAEEAFGGHSPPGAIERAIDYRLSGAQAGFAFWEDGGPVAMAGFVGPTPDGIRIGPVYTPPALRGRGYARAATAVLSQQLIDEGRRFCALYTDLANPTANYIYQQIGYEPVADSEEYHFTR